MTLLVASCNKKQLETTYDKQETNIQKIIESLKKANPEATVEYIKGSAVVTTVHGEGESLAENGAVSFYYAGYVVSGASLANGNVFATNYETFAKSIRWNVTDSTAFNISTVKLGEDDPLAAPREANSKATAPVPPKRSRTFRSSNSYSLFRILNSPSLAKSVVGLAL